MAWFTAERKAFLEEHGYVVIPGVADEAFCARAKAELLAFIAAWDPALTPENPAAWKVASMPAGSINGTSRVG